MKVVLVLLAVYALCWLLRRSFGSRRAPGPTVAQRPAQTILACAHCGVHLPQDETLPGRGGVFCGEAHRAAFDKNHPGA